MKEHSTTVPGIDEQLGDLADAADVLDAIRVGESQVAVQAVAHVVAIEHVGVHALRVQLALDDVGDGALAGAGQSGEPQDRRPVAVHARRATPCRPAGSGDGCWSRAAGRR